MKNENTMTYDVYPCDLDPMGECPKWCQDCHNCKGWNLSADNSSDTSDEDMVTTMEELKYQFDAMEAGDPNRGVAYDLIVNLSDDFESSLGWEFDDAL